MINFRTLKKDFSPAILNEGKQLFEQKTVLSAKILSLTADAVRLSCRVLGNYDNSYECEIEIDRLDSSVIDSDCDCSYKYDCQHLAAVVFYLEEYLDKLVVVYSNESSIEDSKDIDDDEKETIMKTIEEAKTKEVLRKGNKQKKELLEEYVSASMILGQSPFFVPEEQIPEDKAELLLIYSIDKNVSNKVDIQLALRLPSRSKPLNIPNIAAFLDSIRYSEKLFIGNKRFHFSKKSFNKMGLGILEILLDHLKCSSETEDKAARIGYMNMEAFGSILAHAHRQATENLQTLVGSEEGERRSLVVQGIYRESLEEPLTTSNCSALLRFELEYLEVSSPKILLNPTLVVEDKLIKVLEDALLFECSEPGMIYQGTYYRFDPAIRRCHLKNLFPIRDMVIPEPLFGTFVENSLPELLRFAEVANQETIENFVTLPFAGKLEAECEICYLDGELEATLHFLYDKIKVPASSNHLELSDVDPFVTEDGIVARNLTEERRIIDALFQDFIFDAKQGCFSVKSEKKIVEFMTEVIPQNQEIVQFICPENLLDQFLYDDTTFTLKLKETDRIDLYEVDLKVNGYLNGLTLDLLWECLASRRSFIEMDRSNSKKGEAKKNKILVLDLDRLAPVVQIFDELGINQLDDHKEQKPLWSLASINFKQFERLPIEFSMSKKLREIQKQMISTEVSEVKVVPKEINAELREYQKQGVGWLEQLRTMHLNGVLADDMGLGKTLQAIISLTQYKKDHPDSLSIVICPTSLVYNWKEEFTKFNQKLKVLPIDGTPQQRKKLIDGLKKYDVAITSYSLLQKDIKEYKKIDFGYVILDEAQHIKNRATRNAKSVKMLNCAHRLILTGTPIENSLEELWSLFDFLMPGLLSSYDRFVEKYIRHPSQGAKDNLENLRRKLSPFILRRMKKDVLAELPPVSEIVYHCHLSQEQKELYSSYAKSAREELSQLVKKEGFDKVQIHVLATLTRLKQICCHPAIFAKEKAEDGDSSKYDMLVELLQTLIEGGHKTVIFSQYTKMLQIMRKDLQTLGIRFEYLDGATKNRMNIVKKFNEDHNIPVFLVSLKAGGSGLNLVGADTVIHYDMWWNPAVENQATDRVHRIGQTRSVSSYKLVTMGTIEEKILELQERKKGLVKKVINTDEEAISKLTWEEVLELLQT
ncbi:SWI/SNF helicase 2 family protein [Waddlia chondrophila 2032/99]|uniref:SWI/SNF helicase 2 family protein n=2 Tax=Waddlia chondrophila TaxID=71667 RepID=D6YS96_WADCW|nr:DEAD/DEAH box helicase [Waddlia chondrophila]ADI38941.1 SWI/SNF helicase 2 family protein [Waddlia chondrophila WSU 86-1044]CCB92060.1 SWI/SNF helicase 2 family protein [Waddlia chondrophila 2032/99]